MDTERIICKKPESKEEAIRSLNDKRKRKLAMNSVFKRVIIYMPADNWREYKDMLKYSLTLKKIFPIHCYLEMLGYDIRLSAEEIKEMEKECFEEQKKAFSERKSYKMVSLSETEDFKKDYNVYVDLIKKEAAAKEERLEKLIEEGRRNMARKLKKKEMKLREGGYKTMEEKPLTKSRPHTEKEIRKAQKGAPRIAIYPDSNPPGFLIKEIEKRIEKYGQENIFRNYVILMSDKMWDEYEKEYERHKWKLKQTYTIFDFAYEIGYNLTSKMEEDHNIAEEEMNHEFVADYLARDKRIKEAYNRYINMISDNDYGDLAISNSYDDDYGGDTC